MTPTKEEYENCLVAGDKFKELVLKRTGLKASELICPREKSEITPCVARDGRLALAEVRGLPVICVGCAYYIENLIKRELEKLSI